jgi:hypothetical protein
MEARVKGAAEMKVEVLRMRVRRARPLERAVG